MSLNVDKSDSIGRDSERNNFKSEFLREGMGRDGIWSKDRITSEKKRDTLFILAGLKVEGNR